MKTIQQFRWRPLERSTLTDRITQDLMSYIQSANFQPGSGLPSERRLSEVLGVSRLPLREALARLRGLGVLKSRQGSVSRLCRLNTSEMFRTMSFILCRQHSISAAEMMEARRSLEMTLAALAAQRRRPDDLKVLKQCLDRMEQQIERRETFIEADVAFHRATACAAHNVILETVMELMYAILWETQHLFPDHIPYRKQSVAFHRAVYQAIESGRPDEAARQMRRHLDDIEQRIIHQGRSSPHSQTATRKKKGVS